MDVCSRFKREGQEKIGERGGWRDGHREGIERETGEGESEKVKQGRTGVCSEA